MSLTALLLADQVVQEHVPKVWTLHVACPHNGNLLWDSSNSISNRTFHLRRFTHKEKENANLIFFFIVIIKSFLSTIDIIINTLPEESSRP
jgi:hypothetical protein